MADTIDNLINYKGNPLLGAGSNADIPVISDKASDLKVINDTIRDIMMLNNEKNVRLYQQKIADRDKLNEMIAQGQVSTGIINPEDQKVVDKVRKEANDSWTAFGGNLNDTEGIRNYQQKLQNYKDVTTVAQTRYKDLAELRKEGAKLTLDKDKKSFQDFYQKQLKKPFGEPISPYQKLHDYSADNLQKTVLGDNLGLVDETGSIIKPDTTTSEKTTTKIVNGKPVITNTETTTPVKGQTTGSITVNEQGKLTPFSAPTTKYYSWDNMRRNAQSAFIDAGEGYQNQQQHFQAVQDWLNNPAIDDITKKQWVDAMNNRLQNEYVQQTDNKFGKPPVISIAIDPATGLKHINNSVSDFAAATVLAGINGSYKITQPGQFNKEVGQYLTDQGELDIKREKLKLDARKLGIEGAKANAYIRNLDTKTREANQKAEAIGTNVMGMYQDLIDKINPNGLVVGETITTKDKKGNIISTEKGTVKNRMGVIMANDLPATYNFIAGPVVDEKTGKVKVGKFPWFTDKNGNQYAIPKYIDAATGKDLKEILKPGYDELVKKGYKKSFDDFLIEKAPLIKSKLKDGTMELIMQGDGGIANFSTIFQSAKLMNAQATTKGGENVMNTPEPPVSNSNEE